MEPQPEEVTEAGDPFTELTEIEIAELSREKYDRYKKKLKQRRMKQSGQTLNFQCRSFSSRRFGNISYGSCMHNANTMMVMRCHLDVFESTKNFYHDLLLCSLSYDLRKDTSIRLSRVLRVQHALLSTTLMRVVERIDNNANVLQLPLALLVILSICALSLVQDRMPTST